MKQLSNYMTIVIPSCNENIDFVCSAVLEFIKDLDLDQEKVDYIKVLVEEAISNATTYAYPNKPGKVSIRVSIFDNDTLEIVVRDWGCGIEDIAKAREPLFTTGGENRAGLGFTVMESFTEELTVVSSPDKGTIVKMKIMLN